MKFSQTVEKPLRLVLLLSSLAAMPLSGRSDPLQSLVASNTAFGLNLYSEVASSRGNLFLSPFSISTCLAMTYAGANGTTAKQMAQVFGFGADQVQFALSFGELQRQLEAIQEPNAIELNIANALWTQEGYPFLPNFLDLARSQYQASINQADFLTQADAVMVEINNWVSQKTHGRIQKILSPGILNPLTRLVLANAIYFKGIWATSFAATNTSTQPFHLSGTSLVPVGMMHQPLASVRYLENDQFQSVELPYATNQASMLILLPRQVDGLHQLEQQLSPALLSAVLAGMYQRDVEIFLPRFTLESSFSLSAALVEMGMPDAFVPGVADFSGLDGTRDLYVSDVIHKAWGEVNEAGTEAAAATVVVIGATAVEPPPPVFRADHPFLFFIRDTQTGSLLFIGRLSEPSEAAPVKSPYQKGQPLMRSRLPSSRL
jgi:serine protease inhibitor